MSNYQNSTTDLFFFGLNLFLLRCHSFATTACCYCCNSMIRWFCSLFYTRLGKQRTKTRTCCLNTQRNINSYRQNTKIGKFYSQILLHINHFQLQLFEQYLWGKSLLMLGVGWNPDRLHLCSSRYGGSNKFLLQTVVTDSQDTSYGCHGFTST